MKVGNIIQFNFSMLMDKSWQNKYAGVTGLIIDEDKDQGSILAMTQYGLEEFHTTYCEVVDESR